MRAVPQFSSVEVEKWNLLLRAYLKRKNAEWVLVKEERGEGERVAWLEW